MSQTPTPKVSQQDHVLNGALDALGTNVLLANAEFDLIYMNKRSEASLRAIENVLRSELGLGSDQLIGSNLDRFHGARAAEIRSKLSDPRNFPIKTKIKLGPLTLALEANAVFDEKGAPTAYVVNWGDITQTANMMEEIARLGTAATEGQLSERAALDRFSADERTTLEGVNNLIDAFVAPINVTAEYVDRISKGDIPPTITDEYKGDFNEIKNNLNACIDVMSGLLSETDTLIQATQDGKLDTRGDAEKFAGGWGQLVGGVNKLIDAFVAPINVTAEYVDRISKGDIPPTITEEYKGDFNEIKNNLNACIDVMNGLLGETRILIQGIADGKLDTRGDEAKFAGGWGELVGGVNELINAFVGPFNVSAEYVDRISKGDIPPTITEEYKGDFNEVKNNLNACIDAMKGLIDGAGTMAAAAAQGQLDTRVEAAGFTGAWQTIVQGLNDTAEGVATPLRDIGAELDKMAGGDLKARVTNDYGGDYAVLKVACNELGDQLQGVQEVLENIKTAARNGQLDTRGDASRFKGDIAGMVTGLNEVLEALIGPFNVSAEYIDRISKGDIPPTITEEYKGDFNEIKNNLNACIDVMKGLLSETNGLIQASKEGKLDTRGDAQKFAGGWGQLIAGINQMLDAVLKPIGEGTAVLDKIAERDFRTRVTGEYHGDHAVIKNSINKIIENVGTALAKVGEAVGQINEGASQVSASSQQLAEGASEQASSIEQVSASLEEMTAMTRTNSENATQANELAGKARQAADKGGEIVKELNGSMQGISDASDQISKIVKVIEEIAFQTNLLALNAAVEAARAGEHGKGFAVVAEEVRNLAGRASDAAKEVTTLIANSNKQSQNGVKIAGDVGGSLDTILEDVRSVSDLIGNIATASQQQAQGIEQINAAVSQMDQVTQQNAAGAEESASASEQMSAQTISLQELCEQFKLDNDGGSVRRSAPRPGTPVKRSKIASAKHSTARAKSNTPAEFEISGDEAAELAEF